MIYSSLYPSPVGNILLEANEDGITSLSFGGETDEKENEHIVEAKRWLDVYFSGKVPSFTPKIVLRGTPFKLAVWEILKKIPYGKVISYGDIAKILADKRGIKKMSAQAVGQAVGKNPVPIIIPCHRVVGTDLSLTGYGGGLDKKKFFLSLERANLSKLYSIEENI